MDKLIAEAPRLFTPGAAEAFSIIAFAIIAIALIGVVLFAIVRRLSRKGSSEQAKHATSRSESYSNH